MKIKFRSEIEPFLYGKEMLGSSVLFPLHLIGGRDDKVTRLNAKVMATLSRAIDSKKFANQFAFFEKELKHMAQEACSKHRHTMKQELAQSTVFNWA